MTRRRLVLWRVHALVSAVSLALGLTSFACSVNQDVGTTALETPDASSTADAAVDSGPEAAPPADASADADADAGPDANLVPNAGFEEDISGGNCGIGWDPGGTGTQRMTSSVAHSGSASCEICATVPGMDDIVFATLALPEAGTTLVPSAWLLAVAGTGLDGGDPSGFVYLNGCFPSCGPGHPPSATPDASTWLLDDGDQQLVMEAGMGQTTYFVEIHAQNGCILVDDVTVIAQ